MLAHCRIEGLFKEAMTSALQLPLHNECTAALSFAAMLLSFASGDVANRALLATTEAVQLAGKLLQVTSLNFLLCQSLMQVMCLSCEIHSSKCTMEHPRCFQAHSKACSYLLSHMGSSLRTDTQQ